MSARWWMPVGAALFILTLPAAALMGSPAPPDPTIGIPTLAVGERGAYESLTMDARSGAVLTIPIEVLRFERLPDAALRVADGSERVLSLVRFEFPETDGSLIVYYDGSAIVATGVQGQTRETSPHLFLGRIPALQRLDEQTINEIHYGDRFDHRDPLVTLTECALRPRPAWTVGADSPSTALEACAGALFPSSAANVAGAATVRISDPQGRMHLWMNDGLAPAVRLAEPSNERDVFRVLRLSRHGPGAPSNVLDARADRAPAIALAPRHPWGPDDQGVDHAFPLSQAYQAALEQHQVWLDEFLGAHPGAYVQRVSYESRTMDDDQALRWTLTLTDGVGQMGICIERLIHASPRPIDKDDLGRLRVQEAVASAATGVDDNVLSCPSSPGHLPPPQALPSQLPSVASLAARFGPFAESAGASPVGGAWSFAFACTDETCARADAVVAYGRAEASTRAPGVTLVDPSEQSGVDMLVASHDGTTLGFASTQRRRDVAPGVETPLSDAESGPGLFGARQDPFTLPPWAAPAGAGLVAAIGTVWWFYTRIDRSNVLSHPARATLLRLIQSRPGIHAAEILRASSAGPSATEHHLAKLVSTGLVATQKGTRYVCYFPRDGTDRRLMEAAPVLKADGARRIVDALAHEPGLNTTQLARRTQMQIPTAHYHLARLVQAGLVQRCRLPGGVCAELTAAGRLAQTPPAAARPVA